MFLVAVVGSSGTETGGRVDAVDDDGDGVVRGHTKWRCAAHTLSTAILNNPQSTCSGHECISWLR